MDIRRMMSIENDERNKLGAEWILPNGEMLMTGSLGAGSGWFCGEDPEIKKADEEMKDKERVDYGLSCNVFVSTKVMEEASAFKRKRETETTFIADVGGEAANPKHLRGSCYRTSTPSKAGA